MTAQRKVKSADDITDIIRTGGHLLSVLDPFWALEAALLRCLCGATAESRCSAAIFAALPSAERHFEVAQSLALLEAQVASAAMKLSPTGVQASLRFVCTHLTNLNMGISMEVSLDSCSKLARGAFVAVPLLLPGA